MKLVIDTEARTLTIENDDEAHVMDLYSREAFEVLSLQWVRVGWNQKYQYTFSWMGRPMIQLPQDMMRAQEVIYRLRPDVIVETGVAHGGSLVFYAGLCKAMNHGRVLGIDIEVREHNRKAIEAHELAAYITLIEGDSIDPAIVAKTKSLIRPGEKAIAFLDSSHAKEHVRAELEAYCGLIEPDCYIVATDGVMRSLADVPRGKPEWVRDNPAAAAAEFAQAHPEFVVEQPAWVFDESDLSHNVTHWPGAWLRRLR